MNPNLPHETLTCDLCIIGGGLSGSFAALAAARHGAKVILMQDRPMLGGNASSEIRMWVRGVKNPFDRETGYISELEQRNIYGNPTLVPSLFDATLYGMLRENENIRLLLNTSCSDAKAENGKIISVTGWQSTTYTWFTVEARLFADCSGDSILAPLVGAEYRKGRESKEEFGETLAQPEPDTHTMGMSVLLAARETDHPVKFIPPSFANVYPTDESFSGDVGASIHAQVRDHKIGTSGGNLWWVELGGECDTIFDADRVRDELLAAIYGVWDHIKNRDDHGFENWELEWVGFLPGKRESRRYVGDVLMNEHDVLSGGHFEDEIAFGGWPLDDHNPYGMRKNEGSNIASMMIPVDEIYGIPYRALYSKNIENLMFAGRNISVTHVALSSTRVMGTCALIGQAMGTGAALALRYDCTPRQVYPAHIDELQQTLLCDGTFLPHVPRRVSNLTTCATVNLSAEERAVLFNGIERPRTHFGENAIVKAPGESLIFDFGEEKELHTLRLHFDPDYERLSISDNKKMRVFAMKLHTGKDFRPVRVASTILKRFAVLADDKEIYRAENNYLSLVKIPLHLTASKIEIKLLETNGADTVRIYGADFIEEY